MLVYTNPVENLRDRKTWLYLVALALFNYTLAQVLGLAKGGASKAINVVLYVAGLLSKRLSDGPYSTAAQGINPTLLMSLLAFAYIGSFGLTVYPVLRVFLLSRRTDEPLKTIPITSAEHEKHILLLGRRKQRHLWVLSALCLFQLALVAFFLSFFYKAMSVAQIFDADLRILSAYIDQKEQLELQSRFASMQTREEFKQVMARMRQDAATLHVKLRPEGDSF